jgi:hypothetical protein
MNKRMGWVLVLVLAPAMVAAQTGKLDLRFDHLAAIAEETVDITLDGAILRLASGFLSNRDEDQRRVKEAISGVTGIYVRSFKFGHADAFSLSEMGKVRSQLDSSWQRIVTVRSKSSNNVEIYVRPAEKTTRGIVIIAAEPRQFTVVHLAGEIDLERLGDLQGEFGMPDLELEVRKDREQ